MIWSYDQSSVVTQTLLNIVISSLHVSNSSLRDHPTHKFCFSLSEMDLRSSLDPGEQIHINVSQVVTEL